MSKQNLPEPWATWMRRAHLHNIRQLSLEARIHPTTTTRAIRGDAVPSDETVKALAAALGVSMGDIYEATGQTPGVGVAWEPPLEAARMTFRQRRAVDEMIRAMVEATDKTPGVDTEDWSIRDPHPEDYDLAAHNPGRGPTATEHEGVGEEPQV